MPRGRTTQDPNILAMALIGYEMERQKIDEKIRQIRAKLGKGGAGGEKGPRKKRTLSVAARKRIAAAQRRRWAEHRKKAAQAAKG